MELEEERDLVVEGAIPSATTLGEEVSDPLHVAECLVPSAAVAGESEKALLVAAHDLDRWASGRVRSAHVLVR